MTASTDTWVTSVTTAFAPLADPVRATGMAAYLKNVSPCIGISSSDRRAAQRRAWAGLPDPSTADLAAIARALWGMPEREYQYAACDLLARHARHAPGEFVEDPTEDLLLDRPWWDTVDALGTAVITPLVARHPEQVSTMWRWWDSGDRWLIRAAIQHQRGLKEGTDLDRLFQMCDRYAAEREFFIAKAIGWALRDVTRWDAPAVQRFVDAHPDLSPVARREAVRGLQRAGTSGAFG